MITADQHRNVLKVDSEVFEKFLNTRIALHIDIRVGMPITRQEFLQAERVGGVVGADQEDIAQFVGDELRSSKEECLQKYLTEFGIGLHDAPQVCLVDFEQLAGIQCARAPTRLRRPESMSTSPVNSPASCIITIRISPSQVGLTISIRPLSTTKKLRLVAPCSKIISPAAALRGTPAGASRAICAAVSLGNVEFGFSANSAMIGGQPQVLKIT